MSKAKDLSELGSVIVTDGSGNVGIGDSSPLNASGYTTLSLNDTTGSLVDLKVNGGDAFRIQAQSGSSQLINIYNQPMSFHTNDTERMRILPTGGITFNGDTAAANALDDYEEGTWAPSSPVNCTINSVFEGHYIKIGSLVHAYCYINLTTSSISFAFYGLPFSSLGYGPATRYYPSGQAFNGHSYVESGSSIMRNDSTSTFTNLNVMFSATYRTT